MKNPTRTRVFLSALAGLLLAGLSFLLAPGSPASAHGNVTGPASRNYGCFERWGSKFQDPTMATQDPMCWQAWQADPAAMWNWNGLFREGVAGNHQGAIPDGQLCSGGRTQSGRYNALDAIGDWRATNVGNSFNVKLFDGARHGADYIRVYVSRPGFNPVTQALKWSDLERVSEIGDTPASQWTQRADGVEIDVPVRVSGRSGRAIVYTIWQASHLDQSYYFCSDVNFGGTTTPPTTTPPTTPPTTTPPTTTPPTTPPTTTPPAPGGACSATYALSSQWQGGFQGNVTVSAGAAALRGWTVTLTFPSATTVQQGWNATVSASGNAVTARNAAYNGTVAAGGTTSFGFIANGTSAAPTVTCAAA